MLVQGLLPTAVYPLSAMEGCRCSGTRPKVLKS